MKRYVTAFVPVDFRAVGIIFIIIGSLCVALRFFSFFTDEINVPNRIAVLGIAIILISLYLIFVTPRD